VVDVPRRSWIGLGGFDLSRQPSGEVVRLDAVIAGVGDETGLDRLREVYELHALDLFRLGVALTGDRDLAEDLVHDAFVRLHRAPTEPSAEAMRAYLRRIVVNLVRDHHRRQVVARRTRPEAEEAPSAESVVDAAGRSAAIEEAIASLSHRQRACIVLHYFEGLTDAEIADTIGVSVGSVKTHLHRARAALARRLEDLR
jgi:RNA polymerase sigma factor (sigma-70 family)